MLLVRPRPENTDTLPNYLLRLTAANGYKNSMQLLRNEHCLLANNRLPSKKIFFGDFDLNRIAMLANVEVAKLIKLSFKHTVSTRCLVFGQEFLTKSINFSNIRVCPFCYQEKQSIPFINSLFAKTFCTKHDIPLLTFHPDSGRRLTWSTRFIWRDIPTWGLNVVNGSADEAERKINAQLESCFNSGSIVVSGNTLTLNEYCDLLEFFARFHHVAYGSNSIVKYDSQSSSRYYSPAYWYISIWPNRYLELLKHFESQPMSSTRLTGIRKCFRDLYDDLYNSENQNSNAYCLLRSVFEQYLREQFSNGLLTQSLSIISDEVKSDSYYTCKVQIAKIFNCRMSRVNLFVREGLLVKSKKLTNKSDLFLRQDVLNLKDKLDKCLTLKQCANYLSISPYHARQLLMAGIMRPILAPSKSNRDWLIERSVANELIQKLIIGASKNAAEDSQLAVKRYTFLKVDFAYLIKLMLAGEIEYNYKVDMKQPKSLLQFVPIYNCSDEPNKQFVTPAEAMRLLNANKNAIYDFIRLGYLKSEKVSVRRTPRPVKMILKTSISEFKEHYLLSRQLTSPKANYVKLSGPDIDGCCVSLFAKKPV